MAAAAPAIGVPVWLLARLSPQKTTAMIGDIRSLGLTNFQRRVWTYTIDAGFQGKLTTSVASITAGLGLAQTNRRFVRWTLHQIERKSKGAFKIAYKLGDENTYSTSEETLHRLRYPHKEYKPRLPMEPNQNRYVKKIAEKLHLPEEATPLEILQAWGRSLMPKWPTKAEWKERKLRAEIMAGAGPEVQRTPGELAKKIEMETAWEEAEITRLKREQEQYDRLRSEGFSHDEAQARIRADRGTGPPG